MSLLELREVCKTFHALGREPVKALRDVNLTGETGTITGLVGESGSGKTTIIKSIVGLEKPTSGTVTYDGINIPEAKGETLRRIRREVQFVFQDPTSSLNPRMTVEHLVGEGLLVHKLAAGQAQRRERVAELLATVRLSDRDLDRYPRSFSGGKRQRIAIARALGFTVLFIAHDLAVLRQICSRVAVIQSGQIVEEGPSYGVLAATSHPYTQALLAAVPTPDPAVARARALARLQEKVA